MDWLKQKVKSNSLSFAIVVLLLLGVSLQGQISQLYAADKTEAPQKDTQTKQDETNKNKYYSVTDELVCGDVSIEAITECAEELDFPSGPCINQKIFFISKDDNKKLAKEVLQGRASSWACVKDKKNKKNIAIGYGTGGQLYVL